MSPRRSAGAYPENWREIAQAVKDEAGWACIRCGHPHDVPAGYMLTVHHLDLDKSNCAWWNIVALCQKCHLQIQHRVNLDRPWVMGGHSEWFKPYVAGWYAKRYLGLDLSRDEVMMRLDDLLELERAVVLGVTS